MTSRADSTSRSSRLTRRTTIVWGMFLAAMTVATGSLMLTGEQELRSGFLAANVGVLGQSETIDPVFQIKAELDRGRWEAIVIDDLGLPAGDADTVDRLHRGYGYQGLGHHFLIGNGNGMSDGSIHVGYRWNEQLPGAHTLGPDADYFNRRAIGICLIGSGDRRPFTDQQIEQLARLVQRLQRELDIPSDRVFLHREIAPDVTGPGRYFAASQLDRALVAATD